MSWFRVSIGHLKPLTLQTYFKQKFNTLGDMID